MSKNIEYQKLLNTYNTLVAKTSELEEQYKDSIKAWKQYEQRQDVVNDHARKLCEKILAKDKKEMTLGNAKSWHSYSTDDLILKAMDSFDSYVSDNIKLIQQLFDVAEDRGRKLDALKEQIAAMVTGSNMSASSVEEIIEESEQKSKDNIAKDKAPNAVKKAAAEGKIELIIEEDSDASDDELRNYIDMRERALETQLTPRSIPVANSTRKEKMMKKAEEAAAQIHIVDIENYINKCSDKEWEVLEAIGTCGISRLKDIAEYINNSHGTLIATVRRAINSLVAMNAITEERVSLPLSSQSKFYCLSDMGKRIYKHHFSQNPVVSELESVIAEHDNASHGYGILEVEKVLIESGKYKSVSSSNRNNPIPVKVNGESLKFIPDIIAKTDRYTEYFEYEMGTHNQVNFNIKCEKMCRVTKFLNFVAPNREIAKTLKGKVDIWLRDKDISIIKSHIIRIGTTVSLKDDSSWFFEYHLKSGKEPVVSKI